MIKKLLTLFLILLVALTPSLALAAEVLIDSTVSTNDPDFNNSNPTTVWISSTEGFVFYFDANRSIAMASTTDSGTTWGNFQAVDPQTDVVGLAVWYDRWTPGDTGTKIHVLTADSGVDDLWYTEYDVVTDTLSTTFAIAGNAGMTGITPFISLAKAENGVLYAGLFDAEFSGSGVKVVTCLSSCTSSEWQGVTPPTVTNPSQDHYSLLLPVLGTNNVMFFQWDITANSILSNIYSATSTSWWGWQTIDTNVPEDNVFRSSLMGATLNPATGKIYLAYVDNNATNFHDINVGEWNNTTFLWTQKTNVITNSRIGAVKIAVDDSTGNLVVAFSQVEAVTLASIRYKVSTDNGATWSGSSPPLSAAYDALYGLSTNIIAKGNLGLIWKYITSPNDDDLYFAGVNTTPASFQDVFNANGSWTAPTGATSADVACWGGGGGGDIVVGSAGGGGGGGAFASSTVAVTSGNSYTVTVGAGGVGSDTPTAGGDSSFTADTKTVLADGGKAAVNTTGGAGGTTANSTGDVKFAGGNGGSGHTTGEVGGGGGGAAGPHGAGGAGASAAVNVPGGGGGGNGGSAASGSTGGASANGGAGGNSSFNDGGIAGGLHVFGGGGGGGGGNLSPAAAKGGAIGGGGGGSSSNAGDGGHGLCTITYSTLSIPTAATLAAGSVTQTTATLFGTILALGGESGTQHGFAYGTDATLGAVIATSTLGSYSATGQFSTGVASLTPRTTYYARAYTTNSSGTGYGAVISFYTGSDRIIRLIGGTRLRNVRLR